MAPSSLNLFALLNKKNATLSNNSGLPRSGKYIWKNEILQVREKSGNFVDGMGNLESQGKVREFENEWQWQAVFRKFVFYVQERKGCTFS